MKIEFFLKKEEHPYSVEFLNKKNEVFNDINSISNTQVKFDYEDKHVHFSFASVKVKDDATIDDVLKVINIFIEELCKSFSYVKKENVLYKFVENNYYG